MECTRQYLRTLQCVKQLYTFLIRIRLKIRKRKFHIISFDIRMENCVDIIMESILVDFFYGLAKGVSILIVYYFKMELIVRNNRV